MECPGLEPGGIVPAVFVPCSSASRLAAGSDWDCGTLNKAACVRGARLASNKLLSYPKEVPAGSTRSQWDPLNPTAAALTGVGLELLSRLGSLALEDA